MAQPHAAFVTNALVGRDAQATAIEAALSEVANGRSVVLLFAGEAGIGKSRMAEEVVRRATGRGWRTAWVGACRRAAAWRDHRASARQGERDDEHESPGPQRRCGESGELYGGRVCPMRIVEHRYERFIAYPLA